MDIESQPQRALQNALETLLRPMCRLLLRHSFSFRAFEDIVKRVYVDVAVRDFGLPGKRPTASRVAVLSGLTRKEVRRLLGEPAVDGAGGLERHNRATRVLAGWSQDAVFLDRRGQPRILEAEGEASFAALVRRYSGDMPAGAVLDELVRRGAVERRDDARLRLVNPDLAPNGRAVDRMEMLGREVADLIDTIDHNLQHGSDDPRYQRKVMYNAIPRSALPAFRALSAAEGQNLLDVLDRWLAEHERTAAPEPVDKSHREGGQARVGLGVYYFEEPLGPFA